MIDSCTVKSSGQSVITFSEVLLILAFHLGGPGSILEHRQALFKMTIPIHLHAFIQMIKVKDTILLQCIIYRSG